MHWSDRPHNARSCGLPGNPSLALSARCLFLLTLIAAGSQAQRPVVFPRPEIGCAWAADLARPNGKGSAPILRARLAIAPDARSGADAGTGPR